MKLAYASLILRALSALTIVGLYAPCAQAFELVARNRDGKTLSVLHEGLAYWEFVASEDVCFEGDELVSIGDLNAPSPLSSNVGRGLCISAPDFRARPQSRSQYRLVLSNNHRIVLTLHFESPLQGREVDVPLPDLVNLAPGESLRIQSESLNRYGTSIESPIHYLLYGAPSLSSNEIFETDPSMKSSLVIVTAMESHDQARRSFAVRVSDREDRMVSEHFPDGVLKSLTLYWRATSRVQAKWVYFGEGLVKSFRAFYPDTGRLQFEELRYPNGQLNEMRAFSASGKSLQHELFDLTGELLFRSVNGETLYEKR